MPVQCEILLIPRIEVRGIVLVRLIHRPVIGNISNTLVHLLLVLFQKSVVISVIRRQFLRGKRRHPANIPRDTSIVKQSINRVLPHLFLHRKDILLCVCLLQQNICRALRSLCACTRIGVRDLIVDILQGVLPRKFVLVIRRVVCVVLRYNGAFCRALAGNTSRRQLFRKIALCKPICNIGLTRGFIITLIDSWDELLVLLCGLFCRRVKSCLLLCECILVILVVLIGIFLLLSQLIDICLHGELVLIVIILPKSRGVLRFIKPRISNGLQVINICSTLKRRLPERIS